MELKTELTDQTKTFRILILGAGFSRPAGLPLGHELWAEVRGRLRGRYGSDSHVEHDLRRYAEYLSACEGMEVDIEAIDYERFLGFLDTEHFLGLKGSDTMSSDGNESQLMVRHAIAEILYERTPKNPPELYRKFAKGLDTSDWILTFNYDTLLESALDAEGVPYRLFPQRFSEISAGFNAIDDSVDEVVVLKLHGSIDWCDRSSYDDEIEYSKQSAPSYEVKHPVFGADRRVDSVKLTDGPMVKNDPLAKLYRIGNVGRLLGLGLGFWQWCPFMLAPSQTKLIYTPTLREFWFGMQEGGGLNLSLGVIGYSLPAADEYARQALYHLFRNYTGYEPDLELFGRKKTPIRILDSAPPGDSGTDIRSRYRFADWSRTDLRLDGFNETTLEWVLA